MGKKQHQKDKMYLTSTEWSTLYGGKRPRGPNGDQVSNTDTDEFRRLPFDHCAVSLQPFENPYCDEKGNIFDLAALLPFVKKFKCNPVTGEKIDVKSLIKLTFTKNADGEYHCPVMFKVFTPNSHIVAIKQTGNVFSHEAIEELNIKTKNWRELLTDTPFVRNDIITLQDPRDLSKFNFSEFHHCKKKLKVENEELVRAQYDPSARVKSLARETKDMMDQLNREYKEPEKQEVEVKKADVVNAAHYSTGVVAAGFTSTSMPIVTVHEAAIRDEDSIRYERIKEKGYVRIETSCGPLNFELHCDKTPKTCENFIKLCEKGYYNGTVFHRSIKHFMIQGGDPTGKGTGGESIWGKAFEDEFKSDLKHEGRGILSMANSGTNTNKSQFFVTYRSCSHLNGKHTVFGRVVGGMDTLSEMEKIEVDKNDLPVQPIVFMRATIFADPFAKVDAILAEERAVAQNKEAEEEKLKLKRKQPPKYKVFNEGKVGKYISPKPSTSTT